MAKENKNPSTKKASKNETGSDKSTTITAASADSVMTAQSAKPDALSVPPSTLMTSTPDPDEVVLTDAEGRRYCRVSDCDQISNIETYCRFHYLLHWKKIQVRKKILADGKLERYIEELTARYTDKFVELLRKDLRTEKDFLSTIQEMELDGGAEGDSDDDDDDPKAFIEEVGAVGEARDDDF